MAVTTLFKDPEIAFLIGTWEWKETKFIDSSAPLLVHYKRLKNSKHTYHIHIADNGVILYLKNNAIYKEQEIVDIKKIINIEVNSLLLYVTENGEEKTVEMQRLYHEDVMNVLYEFPYTKKDNGVYNWFYKVVE